MSVMSLLVPPAGTVSGTMTGSERLGTRDPKEIATGGGSQTLTLDLGSVQSVDTAFLGFASSTGSLNVTYSVGGGEQSFGPGFMAQASGAPAGGPFHYLSVLDAPVSARYIIVRGSLSFAGIMAAGKSFRPTWGPEFGGGRGIIDAGSVQRLRSGGFGIDEGAIAGAWQFTLGDLTDLDLRTLYADLRRAGETRTVLAVEDPASANDLHFGIHWGLMTKIDTYERLVPGATRWGLRVEEWAA